MSKPTLVKLGTSKYPERLASIHTPPKQLYLLGELPAQENWVAMVGSRKATPYGKQVAQRTAAGLAEREVVIVSGLALGIDTASHEGALEGGGKTVAVLGGGFNHLYPASNRGLAKRILDSGGALISEYPPDMPPLPQQFAARNRIIAGLCQLTLVVEAAFASGSLITATFALEAAREVMAVPGNINQPSSEGCNRLIATGAQPFLETGDILRILNIKEDKEHHALNFDNPLEERIYELIRVGTTSTDDIIAATAVDFTIISRHLTVLELKGYIHPQGSGHWAI